MLILWVAMTTSAPYTVFVSGVSREFEAARDQVASDLRARGITVKVQSDFRQEAGADTVMRKLHDYIASCSAVVCLVGRDGGAYPSRSSSRPYEALLPRCLDRASYTQWELLFARRCNRRLSVYIAGNEFQQATRGKDWRQDDRQESFVEYIEELDLDRSIFSSVDELCRLVLREDWPSLQQHKPVYLPYPSLGHLFKGRDQFLEQIHRALRGPDHGGWQAAAITASATSAAVHGLGGIGKTRAAVEYALDHADDCPALLLVGADSPGGLQQNLGALSGPGVLDLPEQEAPEADTQVAAVLRWLRQNPGWLLILDNVDDEDAASATRDLLGTLQGGRVLITSRLSCWSADVQTLAMNVLPPADAATFLLERTDREPGRRKAPDDVHTARLLAQELGGLALALEQAGAYIVRRRLRFDDYLRRWRESRQAVLAWFDERLMRYPKSVAMTWRGSKIQHDLKGVTTSPQ